MNFYGESVKGIVNFIADTRRTTFTFHTFAYIV